ncbi:MAG: sugar phosphate isomerase/epimerase family protein [Vulcanisaeta sp.]
MEILVSVKPIKDLPRLSVQAELDIRGFPDIDKFLPALAVELEDLGLRVGQVRVGYLRRRGDAERFMMLLDYLNSDSMVARPGINDVNVLAELLDEASMYGIRVVWEFGVGDFLRSPGEVVELANEVSPHRLNIALHVARERGLRDFIRRFVELSGYVKAIYFSNKRGGSFGLPIFDGSIDFLKLMKVLQVLRYDENVVLHYLPSYYGRYGVDLEVLNSFINSLGSGGADKRLIKSIERIVSEVLNQG